MERDKVEKEKEGGDQRKVRDLDLQSHLIKL